MQRSKNILASSLILLPFLSLGNVALIQETSGTRMGGFADRLRAERLLALLDSDRARTYLGLDGPQAERLRRIVLAAETANVKSTAEMEVCGIELREALRADKPDRNGILKKVQEISDLRGEMMKRVVEAILAAKELLSPEQQKKMLFLIESRDGRDPAGEELRGPRAKSAPGSDEPSPPIRIHPGEPPVQ